MSTETAKPNYNALMTANADKKNMLVMLEHPQLRETIRQLLPSNVKEERFLNTFKAWIGNTMGDYQVANITRKVSVASMLGFLMVAARTGLEIGGIRGEIHAIPYGDKLTPVIGWRGLTTLAMRSGNYLHIYAELVYSKDTFRRTLGLDPNMIHELPKGADGIEITDPDARGSLVGAYAVAVPRDASVPPQFRPHFFMSIRELEDLRTKQLKNLKGDRAERSPWNTEFEAMCKKTVIRRLCNNQLELTPEDRRVLDIVDGAKTITATVKDFGTLKEITADNLPDLVVNVEEEDVEEPAAPAAKDGFKAALDRAASGKEQEPEPEKRKREPKQKAVVHDDRPAPEPPPDLNDDVPWDRPEKTAAPAPAPAEAPTGARGAREWESLPPEMQVHLLGNVLDAKAKISGTDRGAILKTMNTRANNEAWFLGDDARNQDEKETRLFALHTALQKIQDTSLFQQCYAELMGKTNGG